MEILIDIPKHIYEHAKEQSEDSNDEWDAMRAIANGTPLPKGHGRLIEVNALLEHELFTFTRYTGIDDAPCEDASIIIDNAPTIIERSDAE